MQAACCGSPASSLTGQKSCPLPHPRCPGGLPPAPVPHAQAWPARTACIMGHAICCKCSQQSSYCLLLNRPAQQEGSLAAAIPPRALEAKAVGQAGQAGRQHPYLYTIKCGAPVGTGWVRCVITPTHLKCNSSAMRSQCRLGSKHKLGASDSATAARRDRCIPAQSMQAAGTHLLQQQRKPHKSPSRAIAARQLLKHDLEAALEQVCHVSATNFERGVTEKPEVC